jgi:hypothetical protein
MKRCARLRRGKATGKSITPPPRIVVASCGPRANSGGTKANFVGGRRFLQRHGQTFEQVFVVSFSVWVLMFTCHWVLLTGDA